MTEPNKETKSGKRKLLLELMISDEGEATLAEAEIPVKIITSLGMPRKLDISEDNKRKMIFLQKEHNEFTKWLQKEQMLLQYLENREITM